MNDKKESDLDKVIRCYKGNIKALEDELSNIKKIIKSRKKELAEYHKIKKEGNEKLCKIIWRL